MTPENSTKQAELTQMKRISLFVLILAVILFCIGLYFDIGWLKAFSEAAMVGGIADWFAVVALFKQPLGLPIPHTALIPKNKDSIGENLGSFITEEFLVRENLEVKIEEFNVGHNLSKWIMDSKNNQILTRLIVKDIVPGILKTIDDSKIQELIRKQFKERLNAINFGEWIALGLESVIQSKKQDQLVTVILDFIHLELQNHKNVIDEKVKDATPLLTFGLVDKKIADGVYKGLNEFLLDARTPESPIRIKINNYIEAFILELKVSKEMQQKINSYINELSQKQEVLEYINEFWLEIKNLILSDLALEEKSSIHKNISEMIYSLGFELHQNDGLKNKINDFVKKDVLTFVMNHKKWIGDLVTSTVKSWEANEVTDKLELQIGKDLQFIRINGTVVGGLVGLVLYLLTHLIH